MECPIFIRLCDRFVQYKGRVGEGKIGVWVALQNALEGLKDIVKCTL